MAKKSTTTAVVVKNDNVSFLAGAAQFAIGLGVELSGSIEDRADRAAEHMNRSQRHMLASGVLLASIKAETEHGQFVELLEERGFEPRTAQRAMQYTQFVLSRPEDERAALVEMPSSKVLALASADPEVIEAMLGDGTERIDALSVRALREELGSLKANLADTQVARDKAETEAEGLRKKLNKGPKDREDQVPLVVADQRAEIQALTKKAQLSIESLNAIGPEIVGLIGGPAHGWWDANLRQGIAALGHLRLLLDGVLGAYLTALKDNNEGKGDPMPTTRSHLTKQEVLETAQMYGQLVALHQHEQALREWERAQSRPKGKGRPANKPEAPKGA